VTQEEVRKIAEFRYAGGGCTFECSYISRPVKFWKDDVLKSVIERILAETPEAKASLAEISRGYNCSSSKAESHLQRFLYDFEVKYPNPTRDYSVAERVELLCNDLDGGPIDCALVAYLDGLSLADEKYDLGKGMVIRRPNPGDMEATHFTAFWPHDISRMPPIPLAVLEFRVTIAKISEGEEIDEMQRMLDLFRLYRLGSVKLLSYARYFRSVIHPPTCMLPDHGPLPKYKYELSQSDMPKLISLIGALKKNLPSYRFSGSGSSRLFVAMSRYREALSGGKTPEERITMAVSCLEALYLKEVRGGLRRTLSQRVAALLRNFHLNASKLADSMKDGYTIRSNFIHGNEQRRPSDELCRDVLNYARVSLQVFLQTNEPMKILKKLDLSLLDQAEAQKLRELLSGDYVVTGL